MLFSEQRSRKRNNCTFQPDNFACSTAAVRSLSDARITLSWSSSSYCNRGIHNEHWSQGVIPEKTQAKGDLHMYKEKAHASLPKSEEGCFGQCHSPISEWSKLWDLSRSVYLNYGNTRAIILMRVKLLRIEMIRYFIKRWFR